MKKFYKILFIFVLIVNLFVLSSCDEKNKKQSGPYMTCRLCFNDYEVFNSYINSFDYNIDYELYSSINISNMEPIYVMSGICGCEEKHELINDICDNYVVNEISIVYCISEDKSFEILFKSTSNTNILEYDNENFEIKNSNNDTIIKIVFVDDHINNLYFDKEEKISWTNIIFTEIKSLV